MDEAQAKEVIADTVRQPSPGQLVDPPEVAQYAQTRTRADGLGLPPPSEARTKHIRREIRRVCV